MSALHAAGLMSGSMGTPDTAPAILGGKSCVRCHEIYSLLHNHIMQQHLADNEGRDTSILNNILLSILALLTTSNKLPEIPLASSTPPVDIGTSSTAKLQGSSDNSSIFTPQICSSNQLPALRLLGSGSGVTSVSVPTIVNAGDPSQAGVQQPVPPQKTDMSNALKSFLSDGQMSLKHLSQLGIPTLAQQSQHTDQPPPLQPQQMQSQVSEAQLQQRDNVGNISGTPGLLPQLGQDNLANLDVLLRLLKASGQGLQTDSDGASGSQQQIATESQSSSGLHMAKNLASSFPLLLSGQAGLGSDIINMNPLQVSKQPETVTSEKSDLDVADILVNKMPIPSISRGETETSLLSLHNLFLKQFSLQQNLLQGSQNRVSREEENTSQSDGKIDLSSISLVPSSSQKDPVSQGLENIAQIVAAQKQLTSLLSLIGKGKMEKQVPTQSKPDLIETPLTNPLFSQASRSNIMTSLPTVCPIPISNLFSSSSLLSSSKAAVQQASSSAHNMPSISFVSPTTTTLSSLANLQLPTMLPSMANSIGGQISLPLATQSSSPVITIGSRPATCSASNFSRIESVISPRTPTSIHVSQSLPSLAEHLFRTTSSRICVQDSPQLFSLASVVSTTTDSVDSKLMSVSKGDKGRESGKGQHISILKLDDADIIAEAGLQGNNAVDKIQGLLNAARLTPQGTVTGLKGLQKHSTSTASMPAKRSKLDRQDSLNGMQDVSPRDGEKEKGPKKLYKCDTCDVTFSVLSTLQAHEQIHLGAHMQCNYCYQVFSNAQEFQDHISLHRGEENVHHCQYCSRLFTSRGDLQKHLAEHTQKRPYKCSHCSKCFRDPGSLQKHERIHTGERPFNCSYCERAFAEYSSLRKHIRVHTGEQPYKCPQCPKAFSISGNLQRHLYIHTGERPYRCTKCPKAFNNPSHLRRHVKNLHDGKKDSPPGRSNAIVKQESVESSESGKGKES